MCGHLPAVSETTLACDLAAGRYSRRGARARRRAKGVELADAASHRFRAPSPCLGGRLRRGQARGGARRRGGKGAALRARWKLCRQGKLRPRQTAHLLRTRVPPGPAPGIRVTEFFFTCRKNPKKMTLCEYELQRLANIASNQAVLSRASVEGGQCRLC